MSITLLHTYFLECCGIKINWTLIAEWDAIDNALMLKEAEQFVFSCHNSDCENSTPRAWVE